MPGACSIGVWAVVAQSLLSLSQEQLATLGVAKDVGDNVGLLAGLLGDLLPAWAVICIGLCMVQRPEVSACSLHSSHLQSPGPRGCGRAPCATL